MAEGRRPPVALTVAGTDSGGGAGVLADVRTFSAHGVWPAAAVTAVTAQNTLRVGAVAAIDPTVVAAQIEAVVSDIGVDALKTGMLANAGVVRVVVAAVDDFSLGPLVVDPVVLSTSGRVLIDDEGLRQLVEELVPRAALVTPNLPEAALLAGVGVGGSDPSDLERVARAVVGLGARAVLVKGGHLRRNDVSPDCLLIAGAGEPIWLEGPRIPGRAAHGTGCVLSAAITAQLALGADLVDACRLAKAFVTAAIEHAVAIGGGPPAAQPDPGSSEAR